MELPYKKMTCGFKLSMCVVVPNDIEVDSADEVKRHLEEFIEEYFDDEMNATISDFYYDVQNVQDESSM